MFSIILTINLVSAQDDNETVIIGTREFTKYGGILVESSILDALTVENQTEIPVVISVNESLDEDVDITKAEILSNLSEDEFRLIRNLKDSEWFGGELTKEGLEKLKGMNKIIRIVESKGGEAQEENTTQESRSEGITKIIEGEIESTKEKLNLSFLWIIGIIIIILIIVLYLIIKKR